MTSVPSMVRRRLTLSVVLLLAGLFGCEGNPSSRPVEAGSPFELADGATQQPELKLGYYYDATFNPFEPGDDCPVFYALQGGSWTMPAVRIRGMVSPAHFQASLTTDAGELLGQIDQMQTFFLQADGTAEIKRLPIPAHHPEPHEDDPIDDLFGQHATLTITVSDDDGGSASASAQVVLVDKPIL